MHIAPSKNQMTLGFAPLLGCFRNSKSPSDSGFNGLHTVGFVELRTLERHAFDQQREDLVASLLGALAVSLVEQIQDLATPVLLANRQHVPTRPSQS